jgi:UDP-GlcNAc:undecaprenyl-phosphate GlcNAc-1-phosphate transferase
MAGTKVAAATLVLIVPTLDAIITIVRRVIQRKSPVWGDRGHFHHRLLDMGFSQQSVAIFYWILTIVFGAVALISSGKEKILALLTISGAVAFILVAVNLKGELGKLKQQRAEK